jgi:hypothetical protein
MSSTGKLKGSGIVAASLNSFIFLPRVSVVMLYTDVSSITFGVGPPIGPIFTGTHIWSA